MMAQMQKVTIYTDGACSGNPGPGGWGAILMYKGIDFVEQKATNWQRYQILQKIWSRYIIKKE